MWLVDCQSVCYSADLKAGLYAGCTRGRFVIWIRHVVCHRLKDELQSTANASVH